MKTCNKAFTLVELIVVIVILSILATIAFLSFGSQSSSARDSTRLSDITQISKWLSTNATISSSYAIPDKNVKIYSWSTLLGYQWEAWTTVKNILKTPSNTFVDPLDQVNYTYSTNAARNKHQVLAFLENSNSISINLIPDTTTNAISYTSRYPYSKWDAMWIILSWSTTSNSYTPIQDISTIQTSTWFDITNTTVNTWMTAFVSNTITSTWVSLNWLAWFSSIVMPTNTWAVVINKWTSATDAWTSCLQLKNNWVTASWTYWINPTWTSTWSLQAYCDMSTDWGGWTLVQLWKANNSSNLMTSNSVWNLNSSNPAISSKFSRPIMSHIAKSWTRTMRFGHSLYWYVYVWSLSDSILDIWIWTYDYRWYWAVMIPNIASETYNWTRTNTTRFAWPLQSIPSACTNIYSDSAECWLWLHVWNWLYDSNNHTDSVYINYSSIYPWLYNWIKYEIWIK